MNKYINKKVGQSDIAKLRTPREGEFVLLEYTPVSLCEDGKARFRVKVLVADAQGKPLNRDHTKREDMGEVTVFFRENTSFDALVRYIAKAAIQKALRVSSESHFTSWLSSFGEERPTLSLAYA